MIASAFAGSSPALAQPKPEVPRISSARPFDPTGWTLLGSRSVTPGRHRDVIPLALAPDPLTELALVVDGGELDVEQVVVRFDDGSSLAPMIKHEFRAGAIQRQIDLGFERKITQVGVRYRVAPRVQVTIRLYGRRPATTGATKGLLRAGAGMPRVRVPVAVDEEEEVGDPYEGWDRRGWRLIGVQRVDDASAWASIKVADRSGAFSQLALVARGGELDLIDLRLRFGLGQAAQIGARHRFRSGARVRVIDMPGATRAISSIQIHTSRLDRRKTRVEIWAR
jgi:hypothetical protein